MRFHHRCENMSYAVFLHRCFLSFLVLVHQHRQHGGILMQLRGGAFLQLRGGALLQLRCGALLRLCGVPGDHGPVAFEGLEGGGGSDAAEADGAEAGGVTWSQTHLLDFLHLILGLGVPGVKGQNRPVICAE